MAVGLCIAFRVMTIPLLAVHGGIDAAKVWGSLICFLISVVWAGIGWHWISGAGSGMTRSRPKLWNSLMIVGAVLLLTLCVVMAYGWWVIEKKMP